MKINTLSIEEKANVEIAWFNLNETNNSEKSYVQHEVEILDELTAPSQTTM